MILDMDVVLYEKLYELLGAIRHDAVTMFVFPNESELLQEEINKATQIIEGILHSASMKGGASE